jgi:hypothetical protein
VKFQGIFLIIGNLWHIHEDISTELILYGIWPNSEKNQKLRI